MPTLNETTGLHLGFAASIAGPNSIAVSQAVSIYGTAAPHGDFCATMFRQILCLGNN